ncbi:MAG: CotH kinase family protein [Acidimicrobiia bacterium]
MSAMLNTRSTRLRRLVAAITMIISVGLVASSCAFATDEASAELAAPSATSTIDGGVLDSSVVHEIVVTFDEDAYDAMIETYSATGDKEWIEATATIDGVTLEQVGLRLKGNSSLRGLGTDSGAQGATVSADDPAGLPWLIRFDKYVDGQDYDGLYDLVVRSNNTETSLNEAVALDLLELAGLASQDAIAVSFSVNGSEPALRLVIEHPDDVWIEDNFEDDGALYKAESTGDYSYRGDDPDSYDEVFDQEAGKDNEDLTPLIEFLDFINNSNDATFNAELADHLDVESFATYLAIQDLIDNFDDINGPGNNSYLYYDSETEAFTVVAWDHNLAFGVQNNDGFRAGGGPGRQPVGVDAAGAAPSGAAPGGMTPDQDAVGGPGGGRVQPNVLVDRFLANPEFAALYDQALVDLDAALYESGDASEVLATWVAVLSTSDLVDADTIAVEAAAISRYFA